VGPERLPELARSVGRAVRQLRQVQDEVRDMVQLGVDDEMREAASEIKQASSGIKRAADVKGAVRRVERELGDDASPTGTPDRRPTRAAGRARRATPDPDAETIPDAEPPASRAEDPVDPMEPPETSDRGATSSGTGSEGIGATDDGRPGDVAPLKRRPAPRRPTGTEPPERP
jgi:sec-independent protein translocase protein TatB